MHRALLARADVTRAERAHVLASLGTDYRKAGLLDRAASAYAEALDVDPRNVHALAGQQKLAEEQRQWREAYEVQTRLARLRKSDDGLVLGFLQAEMGEEARRAGQRDAAEAAFRTAVSLDRRVFPAHLGLAAMWAGSDPRRAASILEGAIAAAPERAYLAFAPARGGVPRGRRAVALRGAVRAARPRRPARLAGAPRPRPPPPRRGRRARGARAAAARARVEPARAARAPRGLADAARARHARPRRAEVRGHGGGVGALRGPAHLHGLPLPRGRHALALPALPRVELVRRGARRARAAGAR